MQSCKSLHCSRTCTKWVYIRQIPSVNAQTRLGIRTVSPEPSLLRTCANWAYIRHILSVNTQTRLSMHAVLSKLFIALTRAQNARTYDIFHQSMLIGAWACVLSHKSLHWSRTCTKWAFIWHILSVKAQTCLSVCVVLSEPLLLSHMHKMGVHMEYFFSQCSDET